MTVARSLPSRPWQPAAAQNVVKYWLSAVCLHCLYELSSSSGHVGWDWDWPAERGRHDRRENTFVQIGSTSFAGFVCSSNSIADLKLLIFRDSTGDPPGQLVAIQSRRLSTFNCRFLFFCSKGQMQWRIEPSSFIHWLSEEKKRL